eukprot:CAMPEP_0115186254 /NCGR_PEP_ID=MMETSP0270-20121206/9888_1 /TAXON_ID=71861 /ORGANISM="Scrippsiella trochoidea, Strain CCMP3099" /LENGTH=98 /DNA_ID=CAMNT_0002599375 /DNA_START=39 /DNA_END=335 /DNA_ORIENTATION=+
MAYGAAMGAFAAHGAATFRAMPAVYRSAYRSCPAPSRAAALARQAAVGGMAFAGAAFAMALRGGRPALAEAGTGDSRDESKLSGGFIQVDNHGKADGH